MISRLLRAGNEDYDLLTQRRLMITNALAYVVAVMTIPYQIFYAIWDWEGLKFAVLAFSPQVLLYLAVPLMHRFGPFAGPTYLVVVWLIFALLFNYFFGTDSGLQYYFLPGATAGVLVFGARQWKRSVVVMLAGLMGFVISTIWFTQPAPFIEVDPIFQTMMYWISLPFAFIVVFGIVFYANFEANRAEERLQQEFEHSENLLYNVLPQSIAAKLKLRPGDTVAQEHAGVSILFADIVNFTPRAANLSAHQVVEFLNEIFTDFDRLASKYELEKIKTIGDAFMVAGGMPHVQSDHPERIACLALDMMELMNEFSEKVGDKVMLRIGMNTGPVVAGVIGTQKLFYDVWGDTVNTAARMETFGVEGRIQLTKEMKDALGDGFVFERRGVIRIKGKGPMEVWFLNGQRDQAVKLEGDDVQRAVV